MRTMACIAMAFAMLLDDALAVDYMIPVTTERMDEGRFWVMKASPGPFVLPSDDPTDEGGSVQITDAGNAMSFMYLLPASQWTTIGAGPNGYKYKGAGTIQDPCKVVIVKTKVIKVVCIASLSTPVFGPLQGVLRIGTNTTRYCFECQTPIRNDDRRYRARHCVAPAACSASTSGAFLDSPRAF